VASVIDSIIVMGGDNDENITGNVFLSDKWSEFNVPINFQSPKLVSMNSLIYIMQTNGDNTMTELWRYQAIYYEIFIPIIP